MNSFVKRLYVTGVHLYVKVLHYTINLYIPTRLLTPDPSVVMFKKATQNFTASDPSYTIPVVRTRNLDVPATAKWRTKNAHFDLSGPLKFGPGQNEKNIVIDKGSLPPGPALRDPFQLELFDPSSNAVIGERKTTVVNIGDGGTLPSPSAFYDNQLNVGL